MRVLAEAQPSAFLLENVEGLGFKGKDEGLKLVQDRLAAINAAHGVKYRATVQVVNAADYGVPQLRRRVFVIGARDGSPFYFPKTTHHNKGESEAAHRSAWDALQDLTSSVTSDTRPKGEWADLLPTIPAGMNYLWHTDRGSGEPLFGRGWRRSACGPFSLETVRVRPPYPSRVSMLSLRGRIAPRFFWTQVRGRRLASAPKATEKTCDA